MIYKIIRFWHTVRYLKPVQLYWRVVNLLPNFPISNVNFPSIRVASSVESRSFWRNQSIFDYNNFIFLNTEKFIEFKKDWNSSDCSKLWLYNLHYFDDLNAIDCQSRLFVQQYLLDKWIDENPVGFGVGWEPYPISLRVVNWIRWSFRNKKLTQKHLTSLVLQVRWLYSHLEYHLLANHLWANGKALLYAGIFFQSPEAESWRLKGLQILSTELIEQCLADGGHFERSPMYHSIFLDDIIDILYLAKSYSSLIDQSWILSLEISAHSMLSWLSLMSHPDKNISFFNDSTFGIAAPFSILKSDYNNIVQYAPQFDSITLSSTLFPNSGFCRLSNDSITCLCDVGSVGPNYIPGHAHAEALSFELSYLCSRVIVNSGVSLYGSSYERIQQRSTSSHSTLAIDNVNSSDVWSGFRVGRRSVVNDTRLAISSSTKVLTASHNGYSHLYGIPIHSRLWSLTDSSLTITDKIFGIGSHTIYIYFHLSPNCQNLKLVDNSLSFNMRDINSSFSVKVVWNSHLTSSIISSSWHPGFNLSVDNKILRLSICDSLPLCNHTSFFFRVSD